MGQDAGSTLGANAQEEKPIHLTACDCKELFAEVLAHPEDISRRLVLIIEEHRRRFDAWVSYLGVFATTDDAGLDYRVRRHPALQDMIIRLLEMLRDNLLLLSTYFGKT